MNEIKYLVIFLFILITCGSLSAQKSNPVFISEDYWFIPRQSGGGTNPVKIKIIPPPLFKFKSPYQFERVSLGPHDKTRILIEAKDIIEGHNDLDKIKNSPKTFGRSNNTEAIYIKDTIINKKTITLSKWKIKGNIDWSYSTKFNDYYQYKLFAKDSLHWFVLAGIYPIDSTDLGSSILKSILTFDYKYVSIFEMIDIPVDLKKLNLKSSVFSFGGKSNTIEFTNNGKIIPSSPDVTRLQVEEKSIIDIPDSTKTETYLKSIINIPITGSYKYNMRKDTIDLYDGNDKIFNSISRDSAAYLIYKTCKSMYSLPPKLNSSNPIIVNSFPGYEFSATNAFLDYYTLVLFNKSIYYVITASCSNQTPEKMKQIKSLLRLDTKK